MSRLRLTKHWLALIALGAAALAHAQDSQIHWHVEGGYLPPNFGAFPAAMSMIHSASLGVQW